MQVLVASSLSSHFHLFGDVLSQMIKYRYGPA